MPRKCLKEVRSEQILAAYATCITRYGLEGATQERIAEQAVLSCTNTIGSPAPASM